mmetsp:Transcript_31977/g.76380  ORF Transcript_31977/g.76380 Transcript_31977/m.76380 type:complete len:95 (+) Transcript_31977:538-822(+)
MHDGDAGVVQYELLERVQHELGNVDNHRKDYAYRPVELWTTAGDLGGEVGGVGGQLEPATEAAAPSDGLPTLDWYGGAAAGDGVRRRRQAAFVS